MSASTSRSPACSPRAWWCTRPISKADGEWVTPAEVKIEGAGDSAPRHADRDRRAGRDRRRSRRCRSRSATPSTPTTSSATYGADTARWFMLSDSPPERDVDLDRGRRAGRLALRAAAVAAGRRGRRDRGEARRPTRPAAFGEPALAVRKAAHGALAKVSDDDREAALQRLRRAHLRIRQCAPGRARRASRPTPARRTSRWAVREAADILVRLFHPMMPHLAEECWAALGHNTLVAAEPWPEVEPALLVENTITLPVQINGKKRADVTVAARCRQAPRSRLPCWRSMRYNGRWTASARKR